MKTIGTYFSGFGGVDIGARAAGLTPSFAVEWDAELATVYRQNIRDHVTVADVTKIDVSALPYVDVFHASPPCTNASVANANAGESPFDLTMAYAVCSYIVAKRPLIFTLENVYMYRNFESWHVIARTLLDCGYTYNYWHVNMADYGVPQTRKRMIVIARRDGKTPMLPEATHAKEPLVGLFGTKKKWVSWYEAIGDLIPTLPDSQFAPWQLERLPENLETALYTQNQLGKSEAQTADKNSPGNTITSNTNQLGLRAFIADGQANSDGVSMTTRTGNEPIYTITSGTSIKRTAKASVNGRVVKMTPRAIARFQTFPDSYILPDKATLAVKGLGNAVPPLFAQRMYESLMGKTAVTKRRNGGDEC